MTATIASHGFGWSTGADRLLVVSVGTGKANPALGRTNFVTRTAAVNAVLSLAALMEDCADQVETVMQWLSTSPTARDIDSATRKAEPPLGGAPLVSYLRYNVLLQGDWCRRTLGMDIDDDALKALEAMDQPKNIPQLESVGRTAGARLVKPEHFDARFDSPAA
jgi:hypothetical protein